MMSQSQKPLALHSSVSAMTLQKLLLSTAAIAGVAAVAAPASALSLKSEQYGNLFETFNSMVNTERLHLADSEISLHELDVESLRWSGGADSVDVFFINEGAGHRNQLFYSANGGENHIIFDDIASTESILSETQGNLDRRQAQLDVLTDEKAWLEESISRYTTELESKIAGLEASKSTAPSWKIQWIDRDIAALQSKIDAANGADFDRAQVLTDLTNGINWRQNWLDRELTLGNNGVGALALGDGTSLGSFGAGTLLDFKIKADGAPLSPIRLRTSDMIGGVEQVVKRK